MRFQAAVRCKDRVRPFPRRRWQGPPTLSGQPARRDAETSTRRHRGQHSASGDDPSLPFFELGAEARPAEPPSAAGPHSRREARIRPEGPEPPPPALRWAEALAAFSRSSSPRRSLRPGRAAVVPGAPCATDMPASPHRQRGRSGNATPAEALLGPVLRRMRRCRCWECQPLARACSMSTVIPQTASSVAQTAIVITWLPTSRSSSPPRPARGRP